MSSGEMSLNCIENSCCRDLRERVVTGRVNRGARVEDLDIITRL